jgi:hypothetical protein
VELTQALESLCHGDVEQAELARQWLRQHGRDQVPLFLETLESELHRDGEFAPIHYDYTGAVVRYPRRKSVLRLAELLADLSDCRALPALMRLAPTFDKPFLQLVEALEDQDTPGVRDALLEALKTLRQQRQMSFALRVARALLELVESNPDPAFRAALPLLAPGFGVPLEFFVIRYRFKTLLASHNLPIPTDAPALRQDFPIPTDERDSNAPC